MVHQFDDDVVQTICTYMNDDPMESNLTIVQGLTGDRGAERAELFGFDGDGADFRAFGPGDRMRDVRIPWLRPISARPEVREQLFALLERATDAFGSR